ncbi:MAG: hypothetical protein RLZZ373_2432 [Pseudomonadota bacterium]|jgi:GTP:adenosylcobinamide-phosphate guanylyltransferase
MSMVLVSSVRTSAARSFAVFLVDAMVDGWRHLVARLAAANQPHEPRTAEELIEWAGAYEATQPSYAADLRAAALLAQKTAGLARN